MSTWYEVTSLREGLLDMRYLMVVEPPKKNLSNRTFLLVQPSSPDASSTSGESSVAMLPEGAFLGSSITDEIEWLQGSHKDQLRR